MNAMDAQEILDKKERLVQRFGPWTAHNIRLEEGIYTIDKKVVGQEVILRRVIQIIQDIAHHPLRELRILDLACLEGLYGIELALQGAKVIGIEGRQPSLEKARFAKEVLDLANLELVQDDVRHITTKTYGAFDVVICAGILYHLDVPEVFRFLERVFELCTDFAIFDTHVSVAAREEHLYKDRRYFGRPYFEHSPNSSAQEKAKSLWASLDNIRSFWFTKPSLLNFLSHTGFTSVYECHNPSTTDDWADRVTLVAIKGTRKPLLCSPLLNSKKDNDWPEKSARRVHPSQQGMIPRAVKAFNRFVPKVSKAIL